MRSVSCVLLTAVTAAPKDVSAEPGGPPQPRYGWSETWVGADATRDVWLLYSGATLAPWAVLPYDDGLRLRASGGYGHYSYNGAVITPSPCGSPRYDPCRFSAQRFNVDVSYIEALAGYQKRFGDLTAKAFIGVASISHQFDVRDPGNEVVGDAFGVKGAVELWQNLGAQAWASIDVGYTTAHDTGSARLRGGWRILPEFSIGPEVHYNFNAEDDAGRAGAFARYEWAGGEISASAGWGGTVTGAAAQDLTPYGGLNLQLRF